MEVKKEWLILNGQQRGVALISILLVLTVLATLAIYAVEDQNLAIRRSQNLSQSEQGYQVNVSGEQWVLKVLEKDMVDDLVLGSQGKVATDYLDENWRKLGPALEVGETGVTLLMTIEDMQGRFNLNSLIQGKPKPLPPTNGNSSADGGQVQQVFWYQIFQRLLQRLALNPELVDPLIDWIDQNEEEVGTTGAEDLYYTGLEQPYRAANRGLASVGELGNIKDFTPEIIEKLSPWVTALPIGNQNATITINVNTAPSIVLASFAANPNLDIAVLEPLLVQRMQQPFQSVNDFIQQFNAIVPAGLTPGITNMLDVRSIYFAGHSCAESGRVKFSMTSLLQKQIQGQNVKVIQRERFFGCPAFAPEEPEEPEQSS